MMSDRNAMCFGNFQNAGARFVTDNQRYYGNRAVLKIFNDLFCIATCARSKNRNVFHAANLAEKLKLIFCSCRGSLPEIQLQSFFHIPEEPELPKENIYNQETQNGQKIVTTII